MRAAPPLAAPAANQQPPCTAARARRPAHGPRPALIGGGAVLAPGPARQWLRAGGGKGGAGAGGAGGSGAVRVKD